MVPWVLPPLPVDVDGDQHEGGGDEDGGDDGDGHTAVHLARLDVLHGRGGGAGRGEGVAAGVERGDLAGDHPAPRPVVGRQLDVVPGGRAQVGDDDVLLLRPGQGRGFNTENSQLLLL